MTHFEITFDRSAANVGRVDVWRVHLRGRIVKVRGIRALVPMNYVYDLTKDPPGRSVGEGERFILQDGLLTIFGGEANGAKSSGV